MSRGLNPPRQPWSPPPPGSPQVPATEPEQVREATVVAVYDGSGTAAFAGRLEGARAELAALKGLRWSWVLVCDGCSGAGLAQEPAVQPLGARIVESTERLGDWPCLTLGARQAPEGWLLLLPSTAELRRETAADLVRLGPGHDWVFSAHPPAPEWLRAVLGLLSGAAPADLGSACLVRRATFVPAASRYQLLESFFGYRAYSRACAMKARVAMVPSPSLAPFQVPSAALVPSPSPSLPPFQAPAGAAVPAAVAPHAPGPRRLSAARVLGVAEADLRRQAQGSFDGVFLSLALLGAGWMGYGAQPIIGLALLGVAGVMLGSYFGKME